MEEFDLIDEDWEAIGLAQAFAHSWLRRSETTPRQLVGLGNALYAFSRLPEATPGSYTEIGIVYRFGTDDFKEMCYIDFRVSENTFDIVRGGSTYDLEFGHDNYVLPGWSIEIGGRPQRTCELYEIDDRIREYINMGAELCVVDESSIEYE